MTITQCIILEIPDTLNDSIHDFEYFWKFQLKIALWECC